MGECLSQPLHIILCHVIIAAAICNLSLGERNLGAKIGIARKLSYDRCLLFLCDGTHRK